MDMPINYGQNMRNILPIDAEGLEGGNGWEDDLDMELGSQARSK